VTAGELLKAEADKEWRELLSAIEGVPERLSWARVSCQPGEYLHSEGSILSNVVHLAGCKIMYGSAAFRSMEVRWRDTVERMESLWPSWEGAKEWLHESHLYWLASWAEEEDFERLVKTNWGDDWPSWRIISTVTQHDSYHAGQIQLLRAVLEPTDEPPPREGETWKEYSSPFSW
jgi:hypothetical protein